MRLVVVWEHVFDCKRDILEVGFLLEELKCLIFSFLRSGVEGECGVEFHF